MGQNRQDFWPIEARIIPGKKGKTGRNAGPGGQESSMMALEMRLNPSCKSSMDRA